MWQSVLNWIYLRAVGFWSAVVGTSGIIMLAWTWAFNFWSDWLDDIQSWLLSQFGGVAAEESGHTIFEWVGGDILGGASWFFTITGYWQQVNAFFPLAEGSIIIFGALAVVGVIRGVRYLLSLIPTVTVG